jgi:hypothetical protein
MQNIGQEINQEINLRIKSPMYRIRSIDGTYWYLFDDIEFHSSKIYHSILEGQMFIGFWTKLYNNN